MFNIDKQQVLDAFRHRRATRAYDPSKKISPDDFAYILELARLSPSSIGSEPWQFLVVILAKKNARWDSAFLRAGLEKRGLDEEGMRRALAVYEKFQKHDMKTADDERALFDWCCKQTYIALGNMMSGAAMIGIDSCPIEGFDYEEVNRILAEAGAFDPQEWGVSVMVTFGYRARDISPRSRKPIDEIVKWLE